MKITVISPQWTQEQAFAAAFNGRLEKQVIVPNVLSESNQGREKIKEAMPVRTGRARSSWGMWTPGTMVLPNPEANATDAVWEVENEGKSIRQGTDVPYVPSLNEGSSRQAPRGFIDAIGLLMLEDLEKAVGDGAEQLWSNG